MMRKLLATLIVFLVASIAHSAIISSAPATSFASGSSTVSSFTINRPSAVNVGDLLFVQITVSASVTVSTVPSGWTQLDDDSSTGSGNTLRQFIYYRRVTDVSQEPANGSTNWGLSSSTNVVASMTGYRSDLGGRSVVLGASTSTASSGTTMTAPAMAATAPGRLLRFYGHRSTNALTSSTLTAHVSASANALATLFAGSRAIANSGTTTTDVITATSNVRFVIHSVLLTESTLTKPTTCYGDTFANGTTFGQNWVTTSVGSTAFTPAINNGRLRLTSNTGYISTAATLQRLFPTSNLIYVEFDYYSYPNASGADGVAVTLSDASITPQPGGFGGSLGYAQRDGSINGFAGGWVGIALDEYGNYSNPTEGRNGGPGFRVDSVAIRGSGSGLTGYPYLAGTAANLNPGVDSSTTPGPGHRYRIVIDAASPGQTYVTVDRDTTGNGTSYTNLIPTFNVEASGSQATIPANLMLSFTGSTGGSSNTHEIGDLSVCATTINTTMQVDHFEFTHDGQGLTCDAENVTIRACANASCSTLMSVPVTVNLNPSGGWNNNPVTFTGSTTLQLRQTTAGTAAISVANSTPGSRPFSTNVCNGVSTNTCNLPFANAGFEFDVPNVLANRPSGPVRLRAVRNSGDASNSCVALFQNTTQNVSFWSSYTTPTTGTRPVELRAGSGSGAYTNIAGVSPGTPLALTFNANGETTFEARYQDAGLMLLNARYTGSGTYAGLILNGSDSFVSKPAGFCIDTPTSSAVCNAPNYAACPAFVAAGMPFQLQVTAAAWESDSDTNFCSGNGNTPNYNQSGIPLTPQLISPTGTGTSAGGIASYSNAVDLRAPPTGPGITITNGSVLFNDITESEVGVFTFSATPAANAYFGQTVNGGVSRNIGRFVPYRFETSVNAAIRNGVGTWGCGFTYQDQPFQFAANSSSTPTNSNAAIVSITALNAANQTTNNYDSVDGSGNSFWKLNAGLAHSYSHLAPPTAGGTLSTGGTVVTAPIATTIGNNDGRREYQITGETFSYSRPNTPTLLNAPFDANLQMNISQPALTVGNADDDAYLDPTNLSTTDRACYRSGCPSGAANTAICTNACTSYSSGAITHLSGQNPVEIRYGRLRLNSTSGPADMNLLMPAVAEYWNGTAFITNNIDNCTALSTLVLTNAQMTNYSGNLDSGETTASIGNLSLSGGVANTTTNAISLSAPGTNNYGSVDITPVAPVWLRFDWDGNAATPFTSPRATASFGTYRGSDRVIYWLETQ